MSKQFSIYLSIYGAIDKFYDEHPKNAEALEEWLSEANPHIWEGECSGDPAVYKEFEAFLSSVDYENLSTYQIAKLYFARLDDYYSEASKVVETMSEAEFNELLARI